MNRQPYKAEKRRKELARQKKQEEKRQKRQEKKKLKDTIGPEGEAAALPMDGAVPEDQQEQAGAESESPEGQEPGLPPQGV